MPEIHQIYVEKQTMSWEGGSRCRYLCNCNCCGCSQMMAGDSSHMNKGKGQSCQKNEVEIQVDHLHSQLPVYK